MSTHSPAISIIQTVGHTNIFDLVRTCSDIRDYTVYNIFMRIISCFQLPYGVIKYLDYDFDIVNNIICAYMLFITYIESTNFNIGRCNLVSTTKWSN